MKILITSDWDLSVVNGVVTSIVNLRDELTKQGHEVRILTLAKGLKNGSAEDTYVVGAVNAALMYPGLRVRVRRGSKVINELIKWKPDVIHSQCEFSTFGLARRISKKTGAPIVHTFHTVYEDYTHYFCPSKKVGRAMVASLTRYITNRSDAVIVPTDKVRELFEGYKVVDKVYVIPTGIVIDKFKTEEAGRRGEELRDKLFGDVENVILEAIGRLAKEKNLEEILEMLRNENTGAKLMVVGGGPYQNNLESKAKELGVTDKVHFTGMISPDNVADYYKVGDLFVCASTSETQGLTYVEALASGRPLLCKKDKCLDGIVEDGFNGWQYTSAKDFLEKLVLYKSMTSEERKRLSENAVATADRFSSGTFAVNAFNLYTELIGA
ncbi:MAG: glycosyltransferase family 4 protein [Lachnospiraceae bacterium]|nr:glycosyltransferase family 4 protein [Lachnospiraceae bacterium]